MLDYSTVEKSTVSWNGNSSANIEEIFWQQWLQYQDYLYRCCLKWMGGNPTNAEDALSSAMLKAWEKVQKHGDKISNFKAWLTKLTFNLCVDIHRQQNRSQEQVKNLDEIPGFIALDPTPETILERKEAKTVICCEIDNLPTRLQETFMLHFYEELSYSEIPQRQNISYQNVCKRVSEARTILRKKLRNYFIEKNQV